MADREKLTALEKAYADTILNTAKEAAGRVMLSERRALHYQQEMVAAREEAVRMLLRLKQMFDSKVKEAEMASLSQQKKIEELEAQLGEAEDIVEELRKELQELQDELGKVASNNQAQLLDEQNSVRETGEALVSTPRGSLTASEAAFARPSLPDAESGYSMKSLISNGGYDIGWCSLKDNRDACDPDFASVVMRQKEPELYRNGCTQRIRAFENGDLSVSGKVDDVNNETIMREDERDGGDILAEAQGKLDDTKVMQADEAHTIRSSRRKRRRANVRYQSSSGAPSSRSFSDQTAELGHISDDSEVNNSGNDNVEAGEDSQATGNFFRKDPESPKPSTGAKETDGKLSLEKIESRKQENGTSEILEVPISQTNIKAARSDAKIAVLTEEAPVSPADNRFLRYTFKRKRKKESLSSPDRDSSVEESPLRRQQTGEKENGSLESTKSSVIPESSRDSRCLTQVAHQLVSLSEKRW